MSKEKLIAAVIEGNLNQLKELLEEKEADPFVVDQFGYSLLHWAVYGGHLKVVEFLTENEDWSGLLDMEDTSGFSVMHCAVVRRTVSAPGAPEVIMHLYKKRPELLVKRSEYGKTPLSGAALLGHLRAFQALSKVVPSIFNDYNTEDSGLEAAVRNGFLEIAWLILKTVPEEESVSSDYYKKISLVASKNSMHFLDSRYLGNSRYLGICALMSAPKHFMDSFNATKKIIDDEKLPADVVNIIMEYNGAPLPPERNSIVFERNNPKVNMLDHNKPEYSEATEDKAQLRKTLEININCYLAHINEKKESFFIGGGLFGQYHKADVQSAHELLKVVKDESLSDDDVMIKVKEVAQQSGNSQHSLARYLFRALTGIDAVAEGINDDIFKSYFRPEIDNYPKPPLPDGDVSTYTTYNCTIL